MDAIAKYGLWGLKGFAALAFIAAGSMKLIGVPDMVAVFDTIDLGQWFRYVTGMIEIASAVLLFVPGLQLIGAGLLAATMLGAVLAHLFIIGPSMVPALVLLIVVSLIAWAHRPRVRA